MPINDLSLPAASLSQVSTSKNRTGHDLRSLSLSVQPGAVLGVVGPQAPDVLDLFAGFTRPSAGTVMIGGKLMDLVPTHRRPIGYVTPSLDLFFHLDVAAHARFAPNARRADAAALLERLGLTDIARKRPASLPPETRLRVALARALSRKPNLLLLDDPFGGLSTATVSSVKAFLRAEAASAGFGVLVTARDATATYGLADRVAILQEGALIQSGPLQELYDEADSLEMAQLMGPLNCLDGLVLSMEDDLARVRLESGGVVEGRAMGSLRPGWACTLAIRPERIAIAAVNPTELGEGAVAARLHEAVFAGDHMRLLLSLDLSGSRPPNLIALRPSNAGLPRGGNVLSLAWQPHHAQVFARKT